MVLTNLYIAQAKLALIADCNTKWTHGAVGTDNTPPVATDIALGTEVFRKARQQHTSGVDWATDSLWIASTEANGNTLVELGFFDAAAAGNLWFRDTYTAIAKTTDKEIWYDVKKTFTVTEV